jgi:hypothetical protein
MDREFAGSADHEGYREVVRQIEAIDVVKSIGLGVIPAGLILTSPHPEERALARVSKDGSLHCGHPSRRIAFAMLLRMRLSDVSI